jgi:indolepyruvate ferredoxin oxidoreductase
MASTVTPPPQDVSLDDKYVAEEGSVFMTGVQALVRVILDQLRLDERAGLNTAAFVSGYQGSPLGTFDQEMARQLKLPAAERVKHVPGLNEELAATSVYGTQLVHTLPGPRRDGVLGVWYGKGPGIDRAADAIRHGNFVGTTRTGGVLALVGDDPSCKSSSIPSASEGIMQTLYMPTLYPGNVQETLEFGLHAIACSRVSGAWTGMKMVTNVADGVGTARVTSDGFAPVLPELDWDGRPFRHEPSGHLLAPHSVEVLERSLLEVRLPLAKLYARANGLNQISLPTREAWLGVVAAGKAYRDLRGAFDDLGLTDADLERAGVRLLKVGMLFPLDEEIVRDFADGLEEILVLEDKGPLLERAVRDALYGTSQPPLVIGKLDEEGRRILPSHSELDSDIVARALARRLSRRVDLPALAERLQVIDAVSSAPTPELPLTARSPFFCSGCPHNRSTKVPDGTQVGVGIGCHSMVLLASGKGEMTTMTQMGSEGAQWIGMESFTDTEHFVQNIGDGTFHHSGSLSFRAAVAARTNITFKLLYNHHVSMTGGQDVQGIMTVPEITRMLEAEGVKRIVVTTDEPSKYRGVGLADIAEVRDRSLLMETQDELAGVEGVTVLIHDQECAAEQRRARKRGKQVEPATRVHINERVCEGCGDCGEKSDCLSVRPVQTPHGRKTQIDQASCNKDYSCLEGDCPSFLTVIPAEKAKHEVPLPPADLPEPAVRSLERDFTVRIPGIGGTGVVTLSQVLGMAAMLEGRHVWSLDQTGLSQKGGPVISDVRISASEIEGSNKATAATADVLLGLDILGAAGKNNLATADPERTVAVVSTSEVATGKMVTDKGTAFPQHSTLVKAIEARTRAGENFYLDAQRMSEVIFDDTMPTNTIVLGAALQLGVLPVSAANLEQAFRINGTGVEKNLAALAWGRAAVARPEVVEALLRPAVVPNSGPDPRAVQLAAGLHGSLGELVADRASDLIGYQSLAYAKRYAAAVREVHAAEAERVPGHTTVTEAFARHLYKLMAYKDEYEVARLHLDAAEQARVDQAFGKDAKVYWNLHPPMLRALGMKRKIKLGPWFEPAFKSLQGMKRVRGTKLDPFGHAEVRKVERALIDEYREAMRTALAELTPETHATVAAIAGLPDMVRGYEDIKLANVELYRARLAELLAALKDPAGAQPDASFSLPMAAG